MNCVTNILDFYNRKSKDLEDDLSGFNKGTLSKLLIKIMKNFNKDKNNDLELQNCLILLVNLFSNNESPDFYNKKGIDASDLLNCDRETFSDVLKLEFLNN
ncbi:unnamed protein product [marine sediment metagenome]|uniref:Uncharacterized protein n=1 Tax=marine sediment metagenome TaxID=412755 RepID=X1DP72_9ZZZZ